VTAKAGIDALLAAKEMVLVCGSGGVGKTTTSAALGLQAATELGGRVLVVTVDPARRLADTLGLGLALGNKEVEVDPERLTAKPRGELWMTMLDMKASWDDLVTRHAPDPATRDAILANPLYRNITARFARGHDYIAMERLHDLHASGRYDLVVVDTPPSRHALDVLDAPARMIEFFEGRLLRWLTVPYRSRLVSAASRPFYQVADRVLGSNFLADIADFFVLLQRMAPGFIQRARATEKLLADPRTAFVVVTTLESAPAAEARFLVDSLRQRNLPLGAVIANRVLPDELRSVAARRSASRLVKEAPALAEVLAPGLARSKKLKGAGTVDVVERVLTEVGTRYHDFGVMAARQAERLAELRAVAPLLLTVPWFEPGDDDALTLARIGACLWQRP